MIEVAILGSTGSIGTQALDLVRRNPDRLSVKVLSAGGQNVDLLAQQVIEFSPEVVAVTSSTSASDLQIALFAHAKESGFSTGDHALPRIISGPTATAEAAGLGTEVVLNAVAGAAGLDATLAALESGSRLALANKESLIIGGPLVKNRAAPGQIVPVDSEHSALAQALRSGSASEVSRLVLTASGGPFRGWSREQLAAVTVDQALAHPTWSMGPLVTINSATMMNKGLEVIEAHLLFDVPFDRIDVVVHPQSVVHSMVEFVDGSTLAQASPPDMRLPIALGLTWPERLAGAAPACDWSTATQWEFFPVDHEAFPALGLAREAGTQGGTAPAALNGADEAAVGAFLAGDIGFTQITDLVERVLREHQEPPRPGERQTPGRHWVEGELLTRDDVVAADAWARQRVGEMLGR